MILQAAYAYAIPSPETLAWVVDFTAGRPVVELGAGRGYWAAQLTRFGVTVEAYDVEPPDISQNASFAQTAGQRNVWHHVGDLGEFSKRSADHSDHVLFLGWPPGWGNTMASEALATFERAGGERVIFIGEPKGGQTGDDAFFDALSARWELASQDARFVSWWNLKDVAQGWVRR
jgi:protein-L-isoaspartate O-methyltransferase